MDYIYIFSFVVVVLIIFGIFLYFFTKTSKKIKSVTPSPEIKPAGESQKNLLPDPELVALSRELMTMVSGTERLYQSNIEIARRDFSRRGIQNPSEKELIKRAIEILRQDNRYR